MGRATTCQRRCEQLGATVDMLEADELAFGDLGVYDAIITGMRAYEQPDRLRASNQRILKYAAERRHRDRSVQRAMRIGRRYGAVSARVSSTRVTDENGQVQILSTDDPVFHYPNEIGEAAWKGWVQERGTVLPRASDPQYIELIQVNEPFENNKGMEKGRARRSHGR